MDVAKVFRLLLLIKECLKKHRVLPSSKITYYYTPQSLCMGEMIVNPPLQRITFLRKIGDGWISRDCATWQRTNGSQYEVCWIGKDSLLVATATWWLHRSEHLLQVNLTSQSHHSLAASVRAGLVSLCKMEHPSHLHCNPKMAVLPGFWVPWIVPCHSNFQGCRS